MEFTPEQLENFAKTPEMLQQILNQVNELQKRIDDMSKKQDMFNSHLSELYNAKSIEETLGIMGDMGKNALESNKCDVYCYDSKKEKLFTVDEFGEREYIDTDSNTIVGEALMKNEIFIENNYNDQRKIGVSADGEKTTNIAVVPLEAKNGDVIGVVVCQNKKDGFSKEDIENFDLENGAIGSAFRMGLENKVLEKEKNIDELTQLPNRQGAKAYMQTEIYPCLQNEQDVTVILGDIDHFKLVNDTHGHAAGDAILKDVTKIFSDNANDNIGVFRWGGEEILIVMKNANTTAAFNFADSIREKIQNTSFDIGDGKSINVTMSMGVQQVKMNELSDLTAKNIFKKISDTAVVSADEKLYEAKESGRNKVIADESIMQLEKKQEQFISENISERETVREFNSELIQTARSADLANYFMTHGFDCKQESRNEVHVSGYGGLRVNTEKNSWYQFSQNRGGKNPIDCLTNVLGVDFKTAVRELTGKDFIEARKSPIIEKTVLKSNTEIKLPERDDNVKKLYAYFLSARHIDKTVVADMLKSGNLYQDKKGNAVFVRRDDNGKIVGAEIHGTNTYKKYKGIVGEGNNTFSFKIGNPTKVYAFESAIDLMSFKEIANPEKIKNSILVSMGGLKPEALEMYKKQGLEIYACVDNDIAGKKFISDNQLKSSIKILDENNVKDWNELLQKMKGVLSISEEKSLSEKHDKGIMDTITEAKKITDSINNSENNNTPPIVPKNPRR